MKLSADWVVGFVDGQGDFRVHLRRDSQSAAGFQVLAELAVVRSSRDVQVLHGLKRFFQGGVIRPLPGDQVSLKVRNLSALDRVCEFLMAHPLKTRKNVEFRKFRRIVRLLREPPLSRDGLLTVIQIALELPGSDRPRLEAIRSELVQHG